MDLTQLWVDVLWDNLENFSSNLDSPWITLGDFNNVLNPEERINGTAVTNYQTSDFASCCNSSGLIDTNFSGSFFTWTNDTTWCKLDRVMVNEIWMQQGLKVHANFGLPSFISNHSPVLATLFEQSQQRPSSFKFFNMWS